jgi:hypothetical protein
MPDHPTKRCWPRFILLLLLIALIGFVVKGYCNYKATIQAVRSAENLRELGGSLLVYANDHPGNYPSRLSDLVRPEPDIPPEFFIVQWGSATPATSTTPEGRAAEMDAGDTAPIPTLLGAARSAISPRTAC